MLDAACPGEVFTSPVPDQILAATKAVDGGAGVVHIVKNYTGDVMNFQMAAELAADEGIRSRPCWSTTTSRWRTRRGRRAAGAPARRFVEKIAGALAEEGAALADVAAVGERVNERLRSVRRRADRLHHAGRRQARLRPARGRDRGRRRHPRRARPPPGEARPGQGDRAIALDAILAEQPLAAGDARSSWSTAWAAPR